jgi:hypothetical protein
MSSVIETPLTVTFRDEAAAGFAAVAAYFAEEVDGQQTLGESLEVLGWAVPSISAAEDDTLAPPLTFNATLQSNKKYASDAPSRTAELNDGVFIDATAQLVVLIERVAAVTGSPVTPSVLASAILQVIQTGKIPFADVSGEEVRKLVVDAQKRYSKPKPGDVLAIPARNGRCHLAVVLERNRFGTALGLFRGGLTSPELSAAPRGAPGPHPVHTDDQPVMDGTWRVAYHDESLLALFGRPEIYHKPNQWPGIVDTGEFGAAETADGTMRMIGPAEAREVGLADGSYRSIYLAEQLQRLLDDDAGLAKR